ncbi:putative porin [Marinicella rhabdoformis]|uniref:putative porin n=1 Tax=Marinicella rhabdoformis TaxID=2580566 RepID=UPI0015CFA0C8|nr:putative porin [Marinicella rhabdoformis]
MKKFALILSVLLSTTFASAADDSAAELAALKAQLQILTERLATLEAKQEKTAVQVTETSTQLAEQKPEVQKKDWTSRIALSGDLRDRMEYIDERGKATRTRNRVRARFGVKAEVNDNLNVGIQLATGSDDPTSTNQTLDGAFSSKGINLDLAYFNWKLSDDWSLTGGKIKNPLHKAGKAPLIWDGDLNPEGASMQYDNNGWQATAFVFSVDERKASKDALLTGAQILKSFDMGDNSMSANLGYFSYSQLKGSTPLIDGKARGNTLDDNGRIANDFDLLEGAVEFNTSVADMPLNLFASFVENTAADEENQGYALGFNLGKVKNKGSWSLGYSYMDVEADAVYALFNDSDFAGGETDSKGHILKAGYGLNKNMSFGLAYIASKQDQSKDQQTAYDRLQLDLKFQFK